MHPIFVLPQKGGLYTRIIYRYYITCLTTYAPRKYYHNRWCVWVFFFLLLSSSHNVHEANIPLCDFRRIYIGRYVCTMCIHCVYVCACVLYKRICFDNPLKPFFFFFILLPFCTFVSICDIVYTRGTTCDSISIADGEHATRFSGFHRRRRRVCTILRHHIITRTHCCVTVIEGGG